MKQLRKIDWALVFLTTLIMLLAASGAAIASWDQPQITLTPGTWGVVEFTNTENEPENIVITNISLPVELLPHVYVTPTSVSAGETENITIHFAPVLDSIRETIPQGIYVVRINGLRVDLDLSTPTPENAENRWAALEARIDALGASLSSQMESLQARITALESAPEPENWVLEIESLRENVGLGFDGLLVWAKSELARIEASILENSPPIDVGWYVKLLDNQAADIRAAIGNDIANMQIEKQIADAKADAEYNTMIWSIGSALAVLCGVGVYFSIKGRFGGESKKTHKRRPSDGEKGDDNPLKTQRKW